MSAKKAKAKKSRHYGPRASAESRERDARAQRRAVAVRPLAQARDQPQAGRRNRSLRTGGVVGGTLGLLAGIGALAIPGLGFFIAAGPIMATLSGLAAGVTVGGLTQALVGMGIPEYEAKIYETKLRSDNILMAVHTDDGADRSCAAEVFKSSGVTDVATQTESAAPARTLRPSDA